MRRDSDYRDTLRAESCRSNVKLQRCCHGAGSQPGPTSEFVRVGPGYWPGPRGGSLLRPSVRLLVNLSGVESCTMVCRNGIVSLYYDTERIGPSQCAHELLILPVISVILFALLVARIRSFVSKADDSVSVLIKRVSLILDSM